MTPRNAGKKQQRYRLVADMLNMGLMFPAAIAIGYLGGYLLDQWWGSHPWMKVILSVLGAGAAFVNLFRVVSRIQD